MAGYATGYRWTIQSPGGWKFFYPLRASLRLCPSAYSAIYRRLRRQQTVPQTRQRRQVARVGGLKLELELGPYGSVTGGQREPRVVCLPRTLQARQLHPPQAHTRQKPWTQAHLCASRSLHRARRCQGRHAARLALLRRLGT